MTGFFVWQNTGGKRPRNTAAWIFIRRDKVVPLVDHDLLSKEARSERTTFPSFLLQGREGDFLDSLVTALSPPRIRGISRLPSAPAAGGWGIPGSLRVNRVGVWGLPLAALWGRWCGRWFFGVDVLPLRWWSSGGAPSRGRRPCRARGSADPPCAAFFSFCCGAAALELCCSSRAGREAGASPATDLLAAEARWGIGARGAPPYAFIVKCSVAARRAVQAASLKGLKVPRQWHGGCRPSSPSPAKLRLSVVALDPPRMLVLRLFFNLCTVYVVDR